MKAIQLVPAMEEGGVERYVVQLNGILVDAGWANLVVSHGGKLDAEITARGGRVAHLEMKSKNPLTAPIRAWRLRQLLKRERPDVVCAHSRVPAWLFVLASRGLGIPWITFAHGANSISRYSRVMTRGDVIMCPSNFVRDYLIGAYDVPDSRFRVVPHGIDASRFSPSRLDTAFIEKMRLAWGLSPETKVVMSVGRITRLKGFDTLIRALDAYRRRAPFPIKLVIVGGAEKGKESYLDDLRALVHTLRMEDLVVFAGAQSQTPECLSLADVVVSANTRKPESFGLSMAEALMMGKPVVAKAFGGALDIVRDGIDGFLTPVSAPDEATAFAEAIGKALTLSVGDLRASAQARFDLRAMSERTLAVYDALAR